jgi:ferritin-like metal-binding protein YciE
MYKEKKRLEKQMLSCLKNSKEKNHPEKHHEVMQKEINCLEFVTEVDNFNKSNVKKPSGKNWI